MDSKYQEALERCKKEFDFNNLAYSHEEIRQRLERVFPELRESEYEMLRKELIQNLKERFGTKGNMGKGLYMPDVLAWLEKRGEQSIITDVLIKAGLKPYKDGDKWCVLVGDNIQDGVCGFGDTIDEALFEFLKELTEMSEKSQGKSPLEVWKDMRLEVYQQASGNRHEPNYSDDSTKMFSLTDIDEIFEKIVEKQGEQKETLCDKCRKAQPSHSCQDITALGRCAIEHEQNPTDKAEPKFKIGDWVIDKQDIVHQIANVIENVTNHTYGYDVVGGGYFNDNTKEVRLWTIQDAKYGDVLFTSSTASHEIFLFKELDRNNNIKCLCSYDSESGFCEGKYHFIGKPSFNTHPATKEQRELLFQKMREAGYKRDSKNKELKKIDQKLVDNVEPKFNVGDWVMLDRPVLITKVEDMPYNTHQYWTSDGKWFGDATKAKLWNIQDAKDGDVLYCENHGIEFIVMNKGVNENGNIDSYFRYNSKDGFDIDVSSVLSACDDIISPATKEQRDLLFQKMHEAGYEWDAENKKLIAIEQKPYPETLDKAIELYYYSYGNGKGGFDNLSLDKFRDIVKTFVDDYGNN